MFLLGWCSDYPDPQNWLSVYFKSTTSNAEDIAYANDDFDALVNEADTTIDQATRMELYQQAQDVILEDSVVAFMYNTVNAYLVKPWVLGLETTPQDSDWPGSNNPVSIDIDANLMP
jgi:oligopeptide transport system substrate-binding protein